LTVVYYTVYNFDPVNLFSDSGSKMYLHELLAGSEVYVEPLKLPEKVGANLFDIYIF